MSFEPRLIELPQEESEAYAMLNFAFKPAGEINPTNGQGELCVWPRVTAQAGSKNDPFPSDRNWISYGTIDILTGKFTSYVSDYLRPEDIDPEIVAFEDARYDPLRNCLIVNAVYFINGIKVPLPMVFSLDDEKPRLIGCNDLLFGAKVISFLDEDHLLSRPNRPFRDSARPTVMLYEIIRTSSFNILEEIRIKDVFFEARPGMDVAGLGTPPAKWDDEHDILLVHEAKMVNEQRKPYHHHFVKVRKKDHTVTAISQWEMLTYEEFEHFGNPSSDWFFGPTYVDGLMPLGNDFITIISAGDRRNILLPISRSRIENSFA